MEHEDEIMNIVDYLNKTGVNWMPINLEVKYCEDKDKNEKELKPYIETGCRPSYTDFKDNLPIVEERKSYTTEYEYIWIDTSDTFQIDIDESDADFPVESYKSKYPYFKSVGKSLPHFFVFCHKNSDTDAYDTITHIPDVIVDKVKGYDFLGGQGSYALRSTQVINANKPLEITEDELIQFFPKLVETKTPVTQNTNCKPCDWTHEGKTSILDIIDIQYIDDREHWMKLVWAMRHSNYSYDETRDFSMKSTRYSDSGFLNVWNSYMSNPSSDECKFGTICHYAKLSNPTAFKTIQIDEASKKKQRDKIRNCTGTHQELALILYETHKHDFVCADSTGKQWYMFNGSVWKQDKGTINLENKICDMSFLFEKEASQVMLEAGIDDLASQTAKSEGGVKTQIKLLKKIARDLQSDSYIKSVLNRARTAGFYNERFLDKLDADETLLGFNNCVYDFKIGSYRQGNPDDYVSMTVGYDYYPDVNQKYHDIALDYFNTLYPDPELRTYMLRMFARQLYGDESNNFVHFHTGRNSSGGNGKSKLFSTVLQNIFGSYIRKSNVGIFMGIQKNTGSDNPNPEMANWRGIRILWFSEPKAGAKMEENTLKDYSGGEIISARNLFSNDISRFVPMFKLHFLCNSLPTLDGNDDGIARRLKTTEYDSKFTTNKEEIDHTKNTFLADSRVFTHLKNDACKMEFIRLILNNYNFDMPSEPDRITVASEEYLKSTNNIAQFIDDYLEFDPNKYVTVKDLKLLINSSSFKGQIDTGHIMKNNFIREFKSVATFYKQKWLDGGNKTNVFTGVSIKQLL